MGADRAGRKPRRAGGPADRRSGWTHRSAPYGGRGWADRRSGGQEVRDGKVQGSAVIGIAQMMGKSSANLGGILGVTPFLGHGWGGRRYGTAKK